jgi:glycosyltransferase involved in cell wall biosynthesis
VINWHIPKPSGEYLPEMSGGKCCRQSSEDPLSLPISAIIPTYNRPALLKRAIQSVLEQTLPPRELIVVDDGSTDDTEAFVRGTYGDKVRYIRQENAGTGAARNRGAREARGEWLSFLDHDDEWLTRRLELHSAAVAADPQAALVYSNFYVVGHRRGERRMVEPPPPEALYPGLRLHNVIPTPAMSIRRDIFLSLGGFNEALRGSCEDWDLLIRVTRRYPAARVREPLLIAHEQESSQSRRHLTMLERELSIADTTLLDGLSGYRRMLWRNRVRAAIYARAAVGAREAGAAGWPYLMKSFGYWPLRETRTGKSRLRTLAADLRDRVYRRRS